MFPCPFCESSLCTPELLNGHMKLKHCTHYQETCHCKYEQCLRGFNNVYAYKNHIISEHINSPEDDTNLSTPSKSPKEECWSTEFSTNYDDQLDMVKVIRTESSNLMSLQKFAKIVEYGTSSLIAKLYANNKLLRSSEHDVLEDVQKFYSYTCIEILKQTFISNGEPHSIEMLELIQVAFDNLKSEHMCRKYFESCGHFIKPQSISVDSYLQSQRSHGHKVVAATNSTIEVTPIDTTFHVAFWNYREYIMVLCLMFNIAKKAHRSFRPFKASCGVIWS
ncbi:hypothetical protein PV325_006392 [Microctonus aethiopoides]|uniref:C2H2-type domain-containing protein n=1 Tax=Microctonus aethiopoides TaxID=144406 RepID=A0AA39FHE7_9HYME|nr:hypothetical protein PV325_006392 [Microctonus aethiopoides]KAK0080869.1 hypothetical protein PV326_007953 [Microctonus aethiopoides]KAK0169634.1 hypothetical protein PV328_011779 [Microctonus aethiopoides]